MTDDIRANSDAPVDLLVVGGLTIDVLDGTEVVGGAARYATEAAHAAGLSVALHTVAGHEPLIRVALERLEKQASVLWQQATTTIVFEHHGLHDERRLRLRSGTEPLGVPEPERLPQARAVLFAPVADEVSEAALRANGAPFRAAGLQGWLRQSDAEGWVERRRLSDVDPGPAHALRGLDLLVASLDELRGDDGPEGLERLRQWAGPGPQLVVTDGRAGAWFEGGDGQAWHVPAEVVVDRHTIGAGDAFAAVLAARRGNGMDLEAATVAATAATARYLATRPPAIGEESKPAAPASPADLAALDGSSWRATRFGTSLDQAPPTDAEFTLEIHGDRLAGRSGCNRFMGGWRMVDGSLRVGPLAGTMMYCDGLMELEGAYLAALQAAAGAGIDADRLTFLDPGGSPVVELTRET